MIYKSMIFNDTYGGEILIGPIPIYTKMEGPHRYLPTSEIGIKKLKIHL